jgi:hypothetical protein
MGVAMSRLGPAAMQACDNAGTFRLAPKKEQCLGR